MAQEIADSKLIDTWGSGGTKIEPDISKIIEGWQLGEQPPHEYMNWLQNTFGSKLNHILKNGVAEWNNKTEYLAGSSVKHSGNVWICETTNTNSEPTDLNANWEKVAISKDLTVTADTLADLRNISYPTNTVWASGYHTKNDGAFGSHIFRLKGIKTTETDNGGTVIIATIGGTDYVYELRYSGAVNVKWFGAKGDGTNEIAILYSAYNSRGDNKVDLDGMSIAAEANFEASPIDIDYFTNGIIKSKNPFSSATRNYNLDSYTTIVDEFKPSLSGTGIDDLNYVSFTSCVNIGGLEIIANRIGKNHSRNANSKSGIILHYKNINEEKYNSKVLIETPVGIDVRDPNLSQLVNTAKHNFVRWEEFDGTNYVTKLSLMSGANIISDFTISGIDNTIFTFGSTLITPDSKVLIAGYQTGTDGKTAKIFRSSEDYTSSSLTFSVAQTFTSTNNGMRLEPVMSYADNKLVILFRGDASWGADNGTDYNGRLFYTYNLEGNTDTWNEVVLPGEIHGMGAEPYQEDYYSFYASNGEDRARVKYYSTKDFNTFVEYNFLYIPGQGGYASLLRGNSDDYLVYWEDIFAHTGSIVTTTRIHLKKINLNSLKENVPYQRKTYLDGGTTVFTNESYTGLFQVNSLYTGNGNGFTQHFIALEDFKVDNLALYTAGTSTASDSAVIEIYNASDDSLVGNSDVLVLSNTNIKFHKYTFSTPASLSKGVEYYFKINGLHKAYRLRDATHISEVRTNKIILTNMYTAKPSLVAGSFMPYSIRNTI